MHIASILKGYVHAIPECARHLLVAMDGAASEAIRGLKAEKDSDLKQIWDALARRFGYVDEPDRAMRRFDVRKQQEGESLAVFNKACVLCIEKLGLRQILGFLKPTHFCVESSSIAFWAWIYKSI